MTDKKITIDIVSDVACPWCYVGKKHLEKALSQLPNKKVTINWHPFELDPTIPAEGIDRETYFTNKFGSMDRFDSMTQRLKQVGKNAGIDFKFDQMTAAIRTLPLHQLIHVANKEGFGAYLKEAFLAAYFEKGLDLRKIENITQVLEPFGWEQAKIKSIMEDQQIAYWVTQEIRHYQNLGVTGVPFFIFNNKYGVSGAQPPEAFIEMIEKMELENQVNGESCDINGENC
jgi:predicted DsbA family dithiol-disulfide isomerase